MPKIIKKHGKAALILGLILALIVMYFFIPTGRAATISNRSITISDSQPSATGVTYDFAGDHTANTVKCLQIRFCDSATGNCNAPTGMSLAAASATDTGWNVWTYSDWSAGFGTGASPLRFYYTYATGEAGTSSASFSATGIQNSSATSTFYARVNTYNNTDCSSNAVDDGVAAFAIIEGITVTATVAETLSFSISDTSIGFGELGTSNVYYATADENGTTTEPGNTEPTQLTVSTNADGGVSITIQDEGDGSSAGLYSSGASKLIAAVGASSTAPTAGTEGYAAYGKNASDLTIDEGFDNDDTSPVAISRSAQTFASTSNPCSSATVDLSLKVAISGTTPAGDDYQDTIVFIATPTY